MNRLCPACRVSMRTLDFDGIQLEDCPECGGVWFDDGEINAVRNVGLEAYETIEQLCHPDVARSDPRAEARLCPSCNMRLRSYQYVYTSPVQLEECSQCFGVWVEDGELQKIYEFLQPVGAAAPGGRPAMEDLDSAGAANRARMRNIAQVCRTLSLRPSPFFLAT